MTCINCKHLIDDGCEIVYEGESYCEDCAVVCDDCGESCLTDDTTYLENMDMIICRNCEENYIYCDDCNNWEYRDDCYYVNSLDAYVCSSCYDNYYCQCSACDYSCNRDDLIWSERDECYYCSDCYSEDYEEEHNQTYSYHSGRGRDNLSNGYRYRVGVELEREDYGFLDSLIKEDYLLNGWVIEDDSSLGGGGFEAVSPILPLRIGDLTKDFKKDDLKELVRAKFTNRCGGHITISDTKRTPDELIDDMAGYLPMLYAMYPNRTVNSYCSPLEKDSYKQGGRYALHKRGSGLGDGLEIRLFDAPKDERDLVNRFRLVKYMLQHKATTIEQGLKELSDNKKLRDVVKYHLDTYEISYKDFYTNIIKYARNIDKVRVRVSATELDLS